MSDNWISVEDGLPEEDSDTTIHLYLVMKQYGENKGNREFAIGHWFSRQWHKLGEFWKVTHWMPLPQPPNDGKVEK